MSRRRRLGCALVLLAFVLGGAGHWAWWYRARAHALAPAASRLLRDRPRREVGGPALPVRLWIPYPHQNLGALGGAVEQPRAVLAAAARLASLPEPVIPRLGPFGIPPARELLVAASPDGMRVRASLRCYPTAAVLTRLAGALAGNPWLAGGEVRTGKRHAVVSWEGLTWHMRAGEGGASEAAGAAPLESASRADDAPALAVVELAAAAPPLPRGRYVLRPEGDDLVLRLGAPLASPPPLPPAAGAPPGVILLWVQRRPARSEALLLLQAERGGLLASLPAAAAWAAPGGAMKVLPGGNILRQLAGVRPSPFAEGELAATGRAAAQRAEQLAPTWLPLAAGRSAPALLLGGWLAIDPAAEQAEQLHRLLEEVPIFGTAEAQRWGDVALVLHAARGSYRELSCWLAKDGTRGELRLAR